MQIDVMTQIAQRKSVSIQNIITIFVLIQIVMIFIVQMKSIMINNY